MIFFFKLVMTWMPGLQGAQDDEVPNLEVTK
jgi:hypothetical protein